MRRKIKNMSKKTNQNKENDCPFLIKIFENSDQYTAILFDTFYLDEFKKLLNTLTDKPISVYVFAYDKNFSKEEFVGIVDSLNKLESSITLKNDEIAQLKSTLLKLKLKAKFTKLKDLKAKLVIYKRIAPQISKSRDLNKKKGITQ